MNIKFAVLCSIGNMERCRNVEQLREAIPELCIVMANRENVFEKHVALFNLEDGYDGIVILEDDVQLCRDFKTRLSEVLSGHEHDVVSMFESAMSRKPLHSKYRKGVRFAWNQCNYYPKEVCALLSADEMMPKFKEYFYAKKKEPWNYPIDTYIAFVLDFFGIDYYMSVPFLVQHMAIPSNFKGRPLKRQSKYFIDDLEEK